MVSEGLLADVYIESLLGVIFWCGVLFVYLFGFLKRLFFHAQKLPLLTESSINECFSERNIKCPCVL